MKPTLLGRRGLHKHKQAVQELVRLSRSRVASAAPTEAQFWQDKLSACILNVLRLGSEETLHETLSQLWEDEQIAYTHFVQTLEAHCETVVMQAKSEDWAGQLIAIPILAWSRFQIPARELSRANLDALAACIRQDIITPHSRLIFADRLFSPEQLPQGYATTYTLTQQLCQSLMRGKNSVHIMGVDMLQVVSFLADVRYIVAAVCSPVGSPMFSWQQGANREDCLMAWRTHMTAVAGSLFSGCAFELQPLAGFHQAWRQSERSLRPYNLTAMLTYLNAMLNVEAEGLRAVIGVARDNDVEEFRIGLTLKGQDQVVHGMMWPLLDDDPEEEDQLNLICSLFRAAGLVDILILTEPLSVDYCDDCGMPLYPTPAGELVHPELPEELTRAPTMLH